jgi:nucleoside 2-deoxyribosyltransferase
MENARCLFTHDETQKDSVLHPLDVGYIPYDYFSCPVCGSYSVSRIVVDFLKEAKDFDQKLVICASYCLKAKQENRHLFWILKNELEYFQKKFPNDKFVVLDEVIHEEVDHAEKPYVLLGRIANQLKGGKAFEEYKITGMDIVFSKISNDLELSTIVNYLIERGLVKTKNATIDSIEKKSRYIFDDAKKVILTVEGWAEVRKRNLSANTNNVFIAIQFNWPGEEELHEKILKAIQRACQANGYEALPVTQNTTGYITDQIISDIKKSRFVIAELTYNNRGVYFESGFARGLEIPVFHVIRKEHIDDETSPDKKLHFDIKQIMYRDWTEVDELEQKLTDWIASAIGPYSLRR